MQFPAAGAANGHQANNAPAVATHRPYTAGKAEDPFAAPDLVDSVSMVNESD